MKMNGINHLNIKVPDIEKSSRFYCQVFGMTEAFREMPDRIFLHCGKDLLTLARGKALRNPDFHFGFQVKNRGDAVRWKKWLLGNKVEIKKERLEDAGGGLYFKDPDGYTIEIFYER
jgi:catechol 2,3-dioxygenase-like lactoylglutathione lyase family enzyme